MARSRFQIPFPESDESAAPSRDVLLAVSSAARGDRTGARFLVARARTQSENRLTRALDTLARAAPSPGPERQEIRGARPIPPEPLPPMGPLRQVEIRRPDGRKARVVLTPTAARHEDILALAQSAETNGWRAFEAIDRNGRAIDRLAAAQRELAERLATLQATGDLALLRGIVEGLAKLERRLETSERGQRKALGAHKRAVGRRIARQSSALKAQTRAAQIQKANEAIASAQSAAFGEKGELLSGPNLVLAVNQLGWSLLPELLEALGLTKPGTTGPLAWLAPLGSLLASQILLDRKNGILRGLYKG